MPEPTAPETSAPTTITYADFERVDIRVGTITDAQPFPQARKPSIRLTIDFGPEVGVKKSAAQLRRRPEIGESPSVKMPGRDSRRVGC